VSECAEDDDDDGDFDCGEGPGGAGASPDAGPAGGADPGAASRPAWVLSPELAAIANKDGRCVCLSSGGRG
jgi:hypothetical protein